MILFNSYSERRKYIKVNGKIISYTLISFIVTSLVFMPLHILANSFTILDNINLLTSSFGLSMGSIYYLDNIFNHIYNLRVSKLLKSYINGMLILLLSLLLSSLAGFYYEPAGAMVSFYLCFGIIYYYYEIR